MIVLACAILWAAAATGSLAVFAIGFLAIGAGLAVPYALAPRLALSALPQSQAGQGAGIVNASTFLGGSIGVATGAIASLAAGFDGVLAMIALAGIIAVVLARGIPEPPDDSPDARSSARKPPAQGVAADAALAASSSSDARWPDGRNPARRLPGPPR